MPLTFTFRKHTMIHLLARIKKLATDQPLSMNYALDGILVAGALSIVANNNNLFAQRLGASAFHLSMLQFLPAILTFFLLIPAGLMADSLKNKRRMMTLVLLLAGGFFGVVSLSPFVPGHNVYFMLVFLALALVSANGMYNLAWQAFFPEVVVEESRNKVLTFRARLVMVVSLVAPLSVGTILTAIPSTEGKIRAHQGFYVLAAVMLLANVFHIKKLRAVMAATPKKVSLAELKTAGKRLVKNKPFILFTGAILFFHMAWHVDWTLYFIGQANYLQMNELLLSLTPVSGMVAQLITLKFWSKRNTRRGVDSSMTYGIFGLALNPIAIIVGTALPHPFGIVAFLTLHFIAMFTFANITLTLFQCLLRVVDEEYRSFSISIYTCLITLSNGVMPVLGVSLYHSLGANARGLRLAFAIIFVMRILAGIIWILRMKSTKAMSISA